MEGLELGALLGSGGFADVFEATEPQLGRSVAVKVFRARVDGMERKSFEREAQAMGRLSGVRNVVHVYRGGVNEDDHPFLVMERMEYASSELVGSTELTADHVLHTGAAVGGALMVAHEAGILHRDLKPANILVDRYGEPALTDFGISSLLRSEGSSSIYAFTAEHAAPELFEEAASSAASDTYSLASTLYTLLEGHPPFERTPDEGPLAFMTRVMAEPAPRSTAVAETIPELDEALHAALAKEPGERPTLAHFVEWLEEIPHDRAVTERRSTLPHPSGSAHEPGAGITIPPDAPGEGRARSGDGPGRGRKGLLLGIAASVLVIAGVVAFALLGRGDDQPTTDQREVAIQSGTDGAQPDAGSPEIEPLDGVENIRPLAAAGVMDTSAILRKRIDEFAATSSAPAIRKAAIREHRTVDELPFGDLPSLIDYGAFNKFDTPGCYRMNLHDLEVLGAAKSFWIGTSEFAGLFAVQLESVEDAKQYFWATELFAGVPADGCDGWPAEGALVDPGSVRLDRLDFESDIDADGLLTAIEQPLDGEGFSAAIAYSAVARQGDVVLVGVSGRLTGTGDPAPHIETLNEMVSAFDQS